MPDNHAPLSLDKIPQKIQFRQEGNRIVIGKVDAPALCLACPDVPCMQYRPEENEYEPFPEFPAHPSADVCPSNAIKLPSGSTIPIIQQEACVLCGVCIERCPIGAIRLTPQGAILESGPPQQPYVVAGPEGHERTRKALEGIAREGRLLDETDEIVATIAERTAAVGGAGDIFANLMARNLLRAINHQAVMRRKGNAFLRMDLVLASARLPAVGEVELYDQAFLDTPRDILDDLAILVARHGWRLHKSAALAIPLHLPNKRSEYWALIEDIQSVTGVEIRTVSMLSMMLALWNRKEVDVTTDRHFFVTRSTESYRAGVLEIMLGRRLRLNSPSTLVESVK